GYVFFFFFLPIRPTPSSPLFPYTTLFRSGSLRITSTRMPTSRRQFLIAAATFSGAGMYWLGTDGANSFSAGACSGCQPASARSRSEEHTSELQSRSDLVCRLLLEKKKKK